MIDVDDVDDVDDDDDGDDDDDDDDDGIPIRFRIWDKPTSWLQFKAYCEAAAPMEDESGKTPSNLYNTCLQARSRHQS